MNNFELHTLATSLAQKHTPAPLYDPLQGGIAGSVVTSGVVAVFLFVAGKPTEAFGQATTIMAVLGFLAPWLYLRSQGNKHKLAVAQELEQLRSRASVL